MGVEFWGVSSDPASAEATGFLIARSFLPYSEDGFHHTRFDLRT